MQKRRSMIRIQVLYLILILLFACLDLVLKIVQMLATRICEGNNTV